MADELTVTQGNFESSVMKSALPVVVDFWAEWCGPCRMIAPVLAELAKEYKDKLVVAKVNVDQEPDLAQKFGVQSIPTLVFVKNGQVVKQQVGAVPRQMLDKIVKDIL
jgi:thioredoxin 1